MSASTDQHRYQSLLSPSTTFKHLVPFILPPHINTCRPPSPPPPLALSHFTPAPPPSRALGLGKGGGDQGRKVEEVAAGEDLF